MKILAKIKEYLSFKKYSAKNEDELNLVFMNRMNRISIIVFLIALIVLAFKLFR